MKKRNILVGAIRLVIVLLLVLMTGCGQTNNEAIDASVITDETQEAMAQGTPDHSGEDTETLESVLDSIEGLGNIESDEEVETANLSGYTRCGQLYEGEILSGNILAVRQEVGSDDLRRLFIKLELYNKGNEDLNFSSIMGFELMDETGQDNYSLSPFVKTDGSHDGVIPSKNKLVGEVAFEIEEAEGPYVLSIAENFDYLPAFIITAEDLGKSFNPTFENAEIDSDYTVGSRIETTNMSIVLNEISVEASQKSGLSIVNCLLEVTNLEDEYQVFMLGMNYDLYNMNGEKMEMYAGNFDLPMELQGNETIQGTASFYYEEGETDFYLMIMPELGNPSLNEKIVFSLDK